MKSCYDEQRQSSHSAQEEKSSLIAHGKGSDSEQNHLPKFQVSHKESSGGTVSFAFRTEMGGLLHFQNVAEA
jgi:hypothetical protein